MSPYFLSRISRFLLVNLTRIYSRYFFTQFTQRCIEKVQQTLIDFISNTTEDIKKRFSQINAKFIADFGKMLFINLLIFDKDNKWILIRNYTENTSFYWLFDANSR